MKKLVVLVFIMSSFASCKKFDDLIPEFEERSISNSQVDLIESFAVLTGGDQEACSIIQDKEEIPDLLCEILIKAERGSEVVFLVDNTGSMSDDIDEVKRNINIILDCLPEGVRLGAGTYGDNREEPSTWYTSLDFTEDKEAVRAYINAISVSGGGDLPESVFDAIYKTLVEFSWKDCEKNDIIIVMGDAEPKTGSGTDHTAEEVLAKANEICEDTQFVPVIVLDI